MWAYPTIRRAGSRRHSFTAEPPHRATRRRGHHERVGELAEAGATWFVVDPPADGAEKGLDALRPYGAEVIEALAQ